MCGITGIALSDPRAGVSRSLLESMTDTLRHRGPDDHGVHLSPGIGLGVRRLAVIDPPGSAQPIHNEDGSVVAVCNGEIYNFAELRAELEARGHRFRSAGDVEVIVHLYEEHGEECLEALRGMFALAVWDGARRSLLLARDRLGQKPLHYAFVPGGLLFGSEIRALRRHPDVASDIDPIALDQYLTFEHVVGERTIFRRIHRLAAGERLLWSAGRGRRQAYWTLPVEPAAPVADPVAELEATLLDSVRLRLVSDVPLGILLSGGIDSSIVAALARRASTAEIRTFSLRFDEPSWDESRFARRVARAVGAVHHEERIDADVGESTLQVADAFDEPFADASAVPTLLLCRATRRHVTVALGGDGGDELFGGYETYLADRLARLGRCIPAPVRFAGLARLVADLHPRPTKRGLANRLRRFAEGFSHPTGLGHVRWRTFLTAGDKQELYRDELRREIGDSAAYEALLERANELAHLPARSRALAIDMSTYLPDDILLKVDRASMSCSLEVRSPFLDHHVVELAARIRPHEKVRWTQTKVVLRRMLRDVLPADIRRRPKQGFHPPVRHWLRHELRELLHDALHPDRISRRGLFRPETVARWIDEHDRGRRDHAHRLWSLLMLELWYERWA